ncbi:MAG: sensor domain-containing diguanylate cyclase [Pseudomonadota bacterium]
MQPWQCGAELDWNCRVEHCPFPLLARALGSAGSAILITDARCAIVWVNAAFTRLSGYALADIAGATPSVLAVERAPVPPYHGLWRSVQDQGAVWHGEVENRSKQGVRYVTEEIVTPLFGADGAVSHFVAIQHDITDRRLSQLQDRHRADHDALTGLASRAHFIALQEKAIAQAVQANRFGALLFLDLDGFKEINDAAGHLMGDAVLKAVAERLLGAVRRSDIVARFGGDEFVVLLPMLTARRSALRLGRKILAMLALPFVVGAARHKLSASLGIAFFPDHGKSSEALLIQADQAMYRAKRRGGNQYELIRKEGRVQHSIRHAERGAAGPGATRAGPEPGACGATPEPTVTP